MEEGGTVRVCVCTCVEKRSLIPKFHSIVVVFFSTWGVSNDVATGVCVLMLWSG